MADPRDTPEASPMPLEVLDPSPIDEEPEFGADGYFPPPKRATTFGLGAHRPAYYLHKAQKYSSYTFSIFAAFHIANTGIIPLVTRSLDSSNNALLLTRPYYQSWPLAEPLIVILPLATHILSGIGLRAYRRSAALRSVGAETRAERKHVARQTPRPKLSTQAMLGYLSVPLVLGHSALTRGLPWQVEGSSSGVGVDLVGHGIALAPVVGYAGFALLVAVTATHMTHGWLYWLGWTPQQVRPGEAGAGVQLQRQRRRWAMSGVSAAVVAAWLAGGLGVLGRAGKVQSPAFVAKFYDELFRHVPLLDRLP